MEEILCIKRRCRRNSCWAQGKDFGRGLIVDHATVHVLSDVEAFSNCPNVM
jgi:hypothetical protein